MMPLNVIITGATGMVGKGALLYCLDSPDVASVLAVGRSSVGISHPKLKELLVPDLSQMADRSDELKGYHACFFCLGVSAAGLSEAAYTKLTYDLTVGFAAALKTASPEAVFCYVSGEGTDSTEQGRVMWARVKGRTENALLKMGFMDAYMFRPGFIKALRGVRTKTRMYALMYLLAKPFTPLIMLSKSLATDTDRVARAMIRVCLDGNESKFVSTREINRIAAGGN